MSYGELKIDTITFTAGGVDSSVSVSGLVQNPTFTGNLTTTGTISGDVVKGNTVSGTTVTGDTGSFTSGIFSTGTAAAPTIVFDGDPDTGFFSSVISGTTTQHVSYALSGVETLRLTNGLGDNRIQLNNFTSRVSEQVLIEDTGSTRVTIVGNNANSTEEGGAYLSLARAGAGSLNSFTSLSSGNVMGKVQFRAANGVGNLFVGASIEARADRNTGSTSTPGNLAFYTTASGSTTPTERMHINSSGNVGIGTSSPASDAQLTIDNGGTGDVAIFLRRSGSTQGDAAIANEGSDITFSVGSSDTVAGLTEAARIDSGGRLLVDATATENSNSVVQIRQDSNGANLELFRSFDTGTTPARIRFANSRGNEGTPTAVADDDQLAEIRFHGHDGTDYNNFAAAILAEVDGTVGTDVMPGALVFSTTAASASSPTERLRIDNQGKLFTSRTVTDTTGDHPAVQINTISTGTAANSFSTGIDFQTESTTRNRLAVTTNNNWIFYRDSGSNEAIRLDASGRLLIGTTSVQQVGSGDPQINLVGTNYSTSAYGAARYENNVSGASVLLGHSRGTQASPNFLVTDDELGKISFCAHAGGTAPNGIGAVIQAIADDDHASSDFPGRLVFQTCPDGAGITTPRMTIKANGRVGIGTIDPQRLCEISLSQNNPTGGYSANSALVISNAASTSNNIGMNFSSGSSGVCFIHFGDQNDADVSSINYFNSTNTFTVETVGVERWRIDNEGRVRHVPFGLTPGAGGEAQTPYYLGLSGVPALDSDAGGASSGFLRLHDLGSTASEFIGIDIRNINSGDMRIVNQDSGVANRANFVVGVDSDVGTIENVLKISYLAAFYATGVYDHTTAGSANVNVVSGGQLRRSTSSAKYKTSIETIEDSYADALLNCRPVWYRSTCTGDNPDWSYWGLIAEEVAAIDPRLVHWGDEKIEYTDRLDEDGNVLYEEDGVTPQKIRVKTKTDELHPEGVAYDRFVPHLLNLIKRQKEQIEALDARLSALENV